MSTEITVAKEDPIISLIRASTEKGVDATALTKLYDLYERETKRRAEQEFNDAMSRCQKTMPLVVRDGMNKQTSSKFASLDAINPIVKPVYTEAGFSLCFAEDDCAIPSYKRTICDVLHQGGHSKRYHIDLPLDGVGAKGNVIGAMNPVQAAISTGTYGQRVLLTRIFNITIADTDQDGQGTGEFITEDQLEELNTLLDEADLGEARYAQFLKWAGIAALGDMTAEFFPTAKSWLEKDIVGKKAKEKK